MQIPKGLLIAGGIGAGGAGLLFLNRDKKPAGGATDASKDVAVPSPAGTVAPGAPQSTGAAGPLPGPATAATSAGPAAGAAAIAGATQEGPYTLIPEPGGSGAKLVLETATQNPVGVLDAQGNLTEVTVDAQGNLVPVAGGLGSASAAQSAASAPSVQALPQAAVPIPQGQLGQQQSAGSQQWGAAQFAALSQQLFANAGDATVGSAASDAMLGSAGVSSGASLASAPAPIGMPAGQVNATGAMTATTPAAQAAQLTVVRDPASGAQVVVDAASQQPVGVLDAQGSIVPLAALGAGQQAVAGPSGPGPVGISTRP